MSAEPAASQPTSAPIIHWADSDPDRSTRERYRSARAALDSDPYSPAALDDAINAGRQLGRWLVVSELLARKIELDEDNPALRFEYATALMRLSRWIEAIPPLMFVVERQPDNVAAWHNLALSNQALGQISEALNCWDRVVALAPGDVDARRSRGEAELDLEIWSAAQADFQFVSEHDAPTRADRLNWSLALQRLDRLEDARNVLEQGLRTDPDWLPGINRLAALLSALITEHAADAPALRRVALEWCDRSLALVPAQPEIEALKARLKESK